MKLTHNFVIGAAGSIGSELCRQLKDVVAIDQDESGIFDLEGVIPEIANIRNRERLAELFEKYRPKIVYHAAAYKHLSNFEREHMEEIVLTNVIGTLNIIKLCEKYKSKLVFISTDKAVNPTSLMGTTKLLGEIMVKRAGGVVVRFGNVLGSRGSVLPIWERQVKNNKPITITDPEMKRYFMTIPDAVKLVIEAGKKGKPGQTLILDMGEQRYITAVAEELFGNYPVKITGAKEGEKLEEELMTEEEKSRAKKNGQFYIL
jgi:FlaA1/EpsC-like NDP-sugar epimerase